MKKKLIILVLLFLTNCGYSTVYKEDLNQDIKIVILDLNGNKEFNNKLKQELKQYFNNNSENEYNLKIKTTFNKNIISKDRTGKASNFEINAKTQFQVSFKGKKQTLFFNESLKIKNNEDSFEQRKYENIIKNNFAKSIKEKLILKLKTLK
tara:strand:- start:566 stop:1018 length:453 start_codon:yes stop_codon:yes gene_type:complete